MICSSVNLDRFILSVLRWADSSYSWRSFRGSRQSGTSGRHPRQNSWLRVHPFVAWFWIVSERWYLASRDLEAVNRRRSLATSRCA